MIESVSSTLVQFQPAAAISGEAPAAKTASAATSFTGFGPVSLAGRASALEGGQPVAGAVTGKPYITLKEKVQRAMALQQLGVDNGPTLPVPPCTTGMLKVETDMHVYGIQLEDGRFLAYPEQTAFLAKDGTFFIRAEGGIYEEGTTTMLTLWFGPFRLEPKPMAVVCVDGQQIGVYNGGDRRSLAMTLENGGIMHGYKSEDGTFGAYFLGDKKFATLQLLVEAMVRFKPGTF